MIVETASGTIDLGKVEATPTIGIIDYSRRVTDDFGVTTIVEREFARRMSLKLALPSDAVDGLQRTLADLRAIAARWVADARFQSLSVRGFYKDFSIDLATSSISYCTLTVEGLTESEPITDTGADPAADGSSSTLRLINPVTVTNTSLIASSVPEADHPEWAAGASYGIGARVIKAATHRVYESAIAGNVGNDPAAGTGQWLDLGPTNRWAMFDQALGTTTVADDAITVTLAAPTIAAVAMLDVIGATVRVQAARYDQTQPVGAGAITFLDLPTGITRVTVTITGRGRVSVGTLLAGRLVPLGVTEASPTAGITDYSRKTIDDFGEVTVVERAWAKRMTARALIRTDALDDVASRIAAVRARPVLWIGKAGRDALTVYGFFKDFSIEVGQSVSKLSLTIEGLSKAAPVPAPIGGGPVAWPDITDPTGTKPTDNADKTSENTSKDTAAVGGKPSTEVVAALDRIEPIAEATELLKRAGIDQQALDRQRDRDVGKLDEALMRALLEANRTREVMRDAGIVIDPVTGRVRIYGVDQTSERVSRVEIDLDAARSRISLLATSNYVNEQIARAQLNPTGQAALEEIITRLNQAEIELDGIDATIRLKADSVTVTTLGGKVTSVEQELDALGEALTLKASTTEVNAIDTRVKAAELKLTTIGDTSALTIAVRQARYAEEQTAAGSLQALLSADTRHRRQLVAAAEARQELYARIVDGNAAEAIARLTLAVRMADSDARLAREESARVTGDRAQAEALTAAEARIGEAAQAQATTLNRAIVDGDEAAAQAVQQVTARLDNVGGITIEQQIEAVVERTGNIEGRYTVAIDANGNLIGFQLIGSDVGPGSFNLINTDLRMGVGRVIYNNGTVMEVQGVGFGVNRDLMQWFGPSMPIAACTRANAIQYKGTDGHIYSAAGISAGGAQNSGRSTDLAANAIATMGPFGTNGKRRVITASYTYFMDRASSSTGGGIDGTPTATLVLERQDDAGWVQIGTITATGSTEYQPSRGGEPGYGMQTMSGGLTVTEPASNTSGTVTYRLRLTARTVATFRFDSPTAGSVQQTLNLQSTEE
jgi:hypothetical protein